MLTFVRTNQFKKDYKRMRKRGNDISKLVEIITMLASGEELPQKNKDHSLMGVFRDCRECHIEPDWLLIYQTTGEELILIRTGTHADLFG